MLRQSIIASLGHVDHGKTKLLDKIRGSATQLGESGGITQAIGASIIPLDTIKKVCGPLLSEKTNFTIPGLLFIDTPGHAAFTTLRKRGGSIADIAILVIDINEGFKPQTLESIDILKKAKTPFVIAANKIDLIPGYKSKDKQLIKNLNLQDPYVQEKLETKHYELVGKMADLGFESERFDRLESYTKQIAIVPVSAITGDGVPELLMVLIGMAQRFLEDTLKLHVKGQAKGTVLEVKETTGLGTTLDVIIYDGILKRNDPLMIGNLPKPIETRVKALLAPTPLKEMRDKKTKFKTIKEVTAATGVKISAPDVEGVIAGMPIRSFNAQNKEQVKKEIMNEVEDALVETEENGIIIKADTLGSLEAMTYLLKEKEVPVRKATIGRISKKDIAEAESMYEKEPLHAVILGFNIEREQGVSSTEKAKIITSDIIYSIVDEFEQWLGQQKKILEAKELDLLMRPAKMRIMPNYVFRQSNPAIVGVEVIEGKIKTNTQVMKTGKPITFVKTIQHEKESAQSAIKGQQVAVSFPHVTVGRQIKEDDIIYSFIPERDFIQIKKLRNYLSAGEIEVLKEIAEIMRKDSPVWGV